MNPRDLNTMLKSIRVIQSLKDLELDIYIKYKNNWNMLKPLSHLASLS